MDGWVCRSPTRPPPLCSFSGGEDQVHAGRGRRRAAASAALHRAGRAAVCGRPGDGVEGDGQVRGGVGRLEPRAKINCSQQTSRFTNPEIPAEEIIDRTVVEMITHTDNYI